MYPSIPEWLEGKDILITGGTGFVGKALIEKLLRSCPGIGNLYLIMRSKKGQDTNTRLQTIISDQLRKLDPEVFKKLVILPGDMSKIECGLSQEHMQILKESVAVVFHAAASVRFDDSLTFSLELNTRGTFELTKIARQMKKLEVFEYVSTTYCNANVKQKVEERVYSSHLDWRLLVDLLQQEEDTLDILVHKLLCTQPNTYTLTKSLAENVVLEASKEIPAVIIRPSVVIPTIDEPIEGWTDNLYGVTGVTVGVSKGVLRTLKCSPEAVMDYLPVDLAVKGMIGAAWTKRFFDDGAIQVYNQAYSDQVPVTYNDIVKYGIDVNASQPMENYIWYPFMILTNNTYIYHVLFWCLQLIPALLLDLLLVLSGRKSILLPLNIKIYNATTALSCFTNRPFSFANEKYKSIIDKMKAEDLPAFATHRDLDSASVGKLMISFQRGIKKYLFKEKEEDHEKYLRNYWRLYYIDRATRTFLVGVIIWKVLSFGSYLLG